MLRRTVRWTPALGTPRTDHPPVRRCPCYRRTRMPAPDDHARTSRLAGLTGGPLTLVRREAARVPVVALTAALQTWERTRGVRSFALRRGNEALQIVAHTPLGRFLPQVVFDDGADDEAGRIAAAARNATDIAARQASRA